MAITFPSAPNTGDQHTAENGTTYEWTGQAWRVVTPTGGGGGGVDPTQPNDWTAVQTFVAGLGIGPAGGPMLKPDGPNTLGWFGAIPAGDSRWPRLNLYTQYTDASNWARIVLDFSYGTLQIYIESAGTGHADRAISLWCDNLQIRAPMNFIGDNEVNIGDPGSGRPRDIFVGRSVHAPTQAPGTSNDILATTEFVAEAIAALVATLQARGVLP